MTWDEIMQIENPNEALLKIDEKIVKEYLSIAEMEKQILNYMEKHGVSMEEMAFYPDGRHVIGYQLDVGENRE